MSGPPGQPPGEGSSQQDENFLPAGSDQFALVYNKLQQIVCERWAKQKAAAVDSAAHMSEPPPSAQPAEAATPDVPSDCLAQNTSESRAERKKRDEKAAELKHFHDVCHAFASYREAAEEEICRIERNLKCLTVEERQISGVDWESKVRKLRDAADLNQSFLNILVSQELDLIEDDEAVMASHKRHDGTLVSVSTKLRATDATSNCAEATIWGVGPPNCIEDNEVSSMNMYKVRSTLKQFAREWSPQRREEREATFGPLLRALQKYVPIAEWQEMYGRKPTVLCPGSGLGRLPFDVVSLGYPCQGNEFSYFMLLGSNFVLNHALEPNSFHIRPYCLNSSNRRGEDDHLMDITFPDISASEAISEGVDFSMCAGDFISVYANLVGEWDAVLTCFFIDTARNIVLYIHVIANIIPAGGMWANIGPLLYHFADSPNEISIELSWEEIRKIVVVYFDIVTEEWVDSFYTTPPQSMLQALYHCIFFVGVRNSTAVDPVFLNEPRRILHVD